MQHSPSMHMGSSKKLVTFEVAFKNKKQIAEGTYAFIFGKPKDLHFSAGQHVRMSLLNPPETDPEGDKRFLTMASTPQEKDLVFAMRMRDTAFKRVLSKMQVGTKVRIEKLLGESPHGSFVLHEDKTKPAVFLVGGIGIVPAYAMVKDAIERKLPHKIFLFYSNRRPEDAPFLTELENLAKQNSSFKLIATMTQADKSWQGEIGKIDKVLLEKYVKDIQSPIYYIAGMPEMVKAMRTLVMESGINEDKIRSEEFGKFTMNHSNQNVKPMWMRHLPFIIIGLVIVAVILIHIGAGFSLVHNGSNLFSLTNPLFYLMLIAMLIIIPFKLKHIKSLTHNKKK